MIKNSLKIFFRDDFKKSIMKEKLLLLATIFCLISSQSFSQSGCLIMRDSIVRLDAIQPTRTHHYFHNAISPYNLELILDDTNTVYYDSIFYNLSNQVIKTTSPNDTFLFTYTAGLISRVDGMGTNQNGPWTNTYNVFYTAGLMTSIILDTNSVTGDPNGFPGSFINISWLGGNPTYIELVVYSQLVGGPPGFAPLDTFGVTAMYDNKNNLQKMLLPSGGIDKLINFYALNNIYLAVFADSVPLFQASQGDTIDYKLYTYNINNDVASIESMPSFFNTYHDITYYFYDCTYMSVQEIEEYSNINLYPNPVSEKLTLHFSSEKNRVARIYLSNGTIIGEYTISELEQTVDVSSLNNGIYFITVTDGNLITSKKFIKE